MSEIDPVLAYVVSGALTDSVVSTTRSSYGTALRSWQRFCRLRGLSFWPIDMMWFCGWLMTLASSVKVGSMKVYMAGVRYHQQLEGYPWILRDNQLVRRVLQYLKRLIPCKNKGEKVPVTVGLLRKILKLLPGWPVLADMSRDDCVFAAASMVGTTGFLRGGEFLTAKASARSMLQAGMVTVRQLSYGKAVVVSVRQPKARWWLDSVEVPCFQNSEDFEFCTVRVWEEYEECWPDRKPESPAFRRADGTAVDREFMVRRTEALMQQSGVQFVSPTGAPMPVKMASWRSGGVMSAVDAGLGEEMIRVLGRWRSSAWRNYLLHSSEEMQGASRALWSTKLHETKGAGGLRVAECDVSGCFVASESALDEEMRSFESQLEVRLVNRQAESGESSGRPMGGLVLRSATG
jgi:hypothetical protein